MGMGIEVNVNIDDVINDFEEEIIELASIVERGEFDFASLEKEKDEVGMDKETPIYRLMLAAYNAGKHDAN